MSQITGIYRIKNLRNGKSYIGQSRNILKRWKQHTHKLNEINLENASILRAAFKKYGLNTQVYAPGEYQGFCFEIIETCPIESLLEREGFYIRSEQPKYNIALMPPNPDSRFKKTFNGNQSGPKLYIQYHNISKQMYYPGHLWGEEKRQIPVMESTHYISSKKREILATKGHTILMIAGCRTAKLSNYFAWSATIVEEFEFFKGDELPFNVIGEQQFFQVPIRLNDINGFDDFLRRQGNFGLGLQNITADPWIKNIQHIINHGPYIADANLSWLKWIRKFETTYGIKTIS